ncbi:hypothetical protein ALI144C_35860 [Actinosynnema sp. ALI-1.44]|uniref:hypothetical protein n=1 Tax=Actinosynnema sp. ALI-1.44 TaxID=1933779 RepID=UPI00097BF6B1|nr:hypothetical protein [Actinosynnema sp. ALI-1.44]ONI76077.1 hypothetical protein ALI144C_35860 [Actinosynnema sp. ALI-1.44]
MPEHAGENERALTGADGRQGSARATGGTTGELLRLQAFAGNQAVARMVGGGSLAVQRDPGTATAADATVDTVVRLLREFGDREATLRACLAAGRRWDDVQRAWEQTRDPRSLLDAARNMAQGNGDAARVYAYLRFGQLRLADKLFIAGIGGGTDEDTIWRLLPAVRSSLSTVTQEFTDSYGKNDATSYGAEYTDDAPLLDGSPNRVAGLLDDEMDGADLIKSMALLTYGELRPVDEVQIALRSVHVFHGDIMAALDKVHRGTPDGTKPPAEAQYQTSYRADLRGILGAELGEASKNFRRARLILDGQFTPLARIRMACEAWVVDTEEIFTALTEATPAQLTESAAEIRRLVGEKWTISDAEEQRIDAILRQGTSMADRLAQFGLSATDTQGVIQAALKDERVRQAFLVEYPKHEDFYNRFTGNGTIGGAVLWGDQLVSQDWQERLRLAVQMRSTEGVTWVLRSSVTTDELRAQVRANVQLVTQMRDMDGWQGIEPLIMPRDDLQARSAWLGQRFDREKGLWGGTASAAAFEDEKRALDAAIGTAADPSRLTPEERQRIGPLATGAEDALNSFIQVRDQLDAMAIQVVGIAIGLVVGLATGGAAAPLTASLLARTALIQGCANVASVWVVKQERITGTEAARAFAVGAASGVTSVLTAGPVMRMLSPAYAEAALTQSAQVAEAVAQREFAGFGLGTMRAAMDGFASNAVGSAVDSASRSQTWQHGIVSGLTTVLTEAGLGGVTGAATSAATSALQTAMFGGTPGAPPPQPPARPDPALITRARLLLESGETLSWQHWNAEILPSFGAHEQSARQALGLARQAILRDIAARVGADLEPLGVTVEVPAVAAFDHVLEVNIRATDGAVPGAVEQAAQRVRQELGEAAETRLGVVVRSGEAVGGTRGTDVYQLGTEAMRPMALDKALQRQVIGDGNWAVPGTSVKRVDVCKLELTVPAATQGGQPIVVDIEVRLVGNANLPSGAHPTPSGGSAAGPGRLQVSPPATPGGHWTGTVFVDAMLMQENVRFVVGHELDEIAGVVQRVSTASGPITDAMIAGEQQAGIFTSHPAPGAQPTSHDHATAIELFELHQQMAEALREKAQALRRGDSRTAEEWDARARRRSSSMQRLVDWMALDDPANMEAKIRLLQQHCRTSDSQVREQWMEFVEELRAIGGQAIHARLAASAAPASPLVDAALVGHLAYAAPRTSGAFKEKGLDGGHSDPELHKFVNGSNLGFRLVQEGPGKAAGANVFRKYAQYIWEGTGPAPRPGDPGAPSPGAPTPPGWARSDVWKTTAQDFPAFLTQANAAIEAHVRTNGPLPVTGTVTMATADGVPIVVMARDGRVTTIFIDDSWL